MQGPAAAGLVPPPRPNAGLQRLDAILARAGDALMRGRNVIQAVQWVMVAGYLVLISVPALMPLPARAAHIWTDLTLFAQFVFWGLWWPFVLLSMVLVGRAWCGLLCPQLCILQTFPVCAIRVSMATSVLSQPHFHNEEAAFAFLEGVRWPNGPVCPHCGGMGRISKIKPNVEKRVRLGLHKCGDCSKQFTVKVGTVFEHGRIPLHKFLQAVHLLCSSKKGISSHQLHRILGVQYKTAWFLSHRIREAMRDGSLAPMGGAGSFVEADETYFGKTDEQPTKTTRGQPFITKHRFGPSGKRAIVALVERGGNVRSFHVDRATKSNIANIVAENISHEAHLRTDESSLYTDIGARFASHETVRHSAEEYVRGDAHTNTVEGVFSIFKRGMKGIYQHCGEKHLHRYLAEFDFRYNHRIAVGFGDIERAEYALRGMSGRRLMYRDS